MAKEAVMSAVAVGAYELHDCIPFSPWLRNSLLPVSVSVCVSTYCMCCVCVCVYVCVLACVFNQQQKSRRW